MIDESWIALIAWCQDNPYTTIERLEIVEGKPRLLIVHTNLTPRTTAKIKVRYNKKEKVFSKQ